MVMLRVDIKLRLDYNQLPLKMQEKSFHVLLIKKNTFELYYELYLFSFYIIYLSQKRFFVKEFLWSIFTFAISPILR